MNRLLAAAVAAIAFASTGAACGQCAGCDKRPGPKGAASVLFLVGGADFHDPVKLPAMLEEVLEQTGDFAVTIVNDPDQLRSASIRGYDLVLIYTTGGELSKEQETGLVQFVEDGGGLVGIHSATDSFKNSDAYWKLLGGRFIGHDGGTFDVHVTGKRHVTMQGLSDFSITDETYRHEFHPQSKLVVLMRRVEDGDPAAWVQYVGKGRVFVTGLGHGEPAWANPAFQQMIVNAMRWADGRLNP